MTRASVPAFRVLALIPACALALTACAGWGEAPGPGSTVAPMGTPSPSVSSFAPIPSPTGDHSEATDDARSPDPDSGVQAGDPVTPEFFISEVNQENNEYFVVIYVRGIFEDGGTCKVIVDGVQSTLTQENTAETDATGTACGSFSFPLDQLGSGEATVTASYESAGFQGESDKVKVELP